MISSIFIELKETPDICDNSQRADNNNYMALSITSLKVYCGSILSVFQ